VYVINENLLNSVKQEYQYSIMLQLFDD